MVTMFIKPDLPVADNIHIVCTQRSGGVSAAPYDSLNLGGHVGDKAELVEQNRLYLIDALPGLERTAWLDQQHTDKTVFAEDAIASTKVADAVISRTAGLAATVMTADCLPVLIAPHKNNQQEVAAIHAGWRGLSAGIIAKTMAKMQSQADQLIAYLGPAIGPEVFEVGEDVLNTFLAQNKLCDEADICACFKPLEVLGESKYLADLYQLARLQLNALGINDIYGGDYCTFQESNKFFSYRRENVTGRQVSLIYFTE